MNWQSLLKTPSVRRFIIGALIGAAVFLIAAGIAEIIIAKENQCLSAIYKMRIMPDRYVACLPEWESYFVRATSRGIVWAVDNHASPVLGWVVMGCFLALVGGVCSRFSQGTGIIVYLVVAVGAVSFIAGLGYVLQFIVL
jgi:hypothetical protein